MLSDIVGQSAFIQKIRKHLAEYSSHDKPLVIIGGKGVGKAFLAAHVHAQSGRKNQPLQSLNFSLLPERDQRLYLLGGGYPDLTSTKRSILEYPTTVVLKHIDHANHYVQDRLVEALNSTTVSRVTRKKIFPVQCRVIFTLYDSPTRLFDFHKLSKDLFDYLAGQFSITVPSLTQRKEDIPHLAAHYLDLFYGRLLPLLNGELSEKRGFRKDKTLDADLIELLTQTEWEDNIRDLMAFVRGLLVFPYEEDLKQKEKLEVMKMLTMLEQGTEFSLPDAMAHIHESIVDRALERVEGHQVNAARLLGISERGIRRKLTHK